MRGTRAVARYQGRKFHLGLYMVLLRHRQWPAARVLFHDDQLLVPAVST